MHELRITLTEWVDDHQPGFVAGIFVDAHGTTHRVVDKLPIFTRENLTASGPWPQPGHVRCTVIKRWRDDDGRELAEINTDIDSVVSEAGVSRFTVSAKELDDVDDF